MIFMKFTERRYGFSLEGINGRTDIKFSNLAGAHTNSKFDDPSKDPQRAITIWFDDEEIADALQKNDFLVGRGVDTYHKDTSGQPLGERYFIKFVAYVEKILDPATGQTVDFRLKVRVNPRTGKEEYSPKIMLNTDHGPQLLKPSDFITVDKSFIDRMDIGFRQYKYDMHKPCTAVINELWFSLDPTSGGRDDYEDDYLEQKWAGVPLSDD